MSDSHESGDLVCGLHFLKPTDEQRLYGIGPGDEETWYYIPDGAAMICDGCGMVACEACAGNWTGDFRAGPLYCQDCTLPVPPPAWTAAVISQIWLAVAKGYG